MERLALIRSFGGGVMSVELVPRGSGESLDPREAAETAKRSGIGVAEAIEGSFGVAYVMLSEPTEPSQVELNQMSDDEWRDLRSSVDSSGSDEFRSRVGVLELFRELKRGPA